MSDFKSITEVFNTDSTLAKLRDSVQQSEIMEGFDKIFPDLKSVVKPVRIEKKVLFLRVENSIWRSELKFRQKIIIERINKYYSDDVIKSIKFLT